MNDDYLWDKSGEPDEEIVRIEDALNRFRWSGVTRDLRRPRFTIRQARRKRLWMAAAAAILVIGIGAELRYLPRRVASTSSWQLLISGSKPVAVRGGELIETSAGVNGTLHSESVGGPRIEPASRLRVLAGVASSSGWLSTREPCMHLSGLLRPAS
jgi:hypothetical protein